MEHVKMLYKHAWSFNKTTGIPFEELLAEATCLYYEAKRDFDPDRGASLFTYTYTRVKNGLIAYVQKDFQSRTTSIEEGVSYERHKELVYELPEHSVLSRLSGMGKVVANYLLTDEDINIQQTSKKVKGEIIMIMRCDGWSIEQIYDGFRELKAILSE